MTKTMCCAYSSSYIFLGSSSFLMGNKCFKCIVEGEIQEYFYDNQLEKQQRNSTDITGWLSWFLDCLGRAISNTETTIGNVLYKARLWEIINQKPVNKRQRIIINRMLEDNFERFMKTSKYAKMAKCSNDPALRDIQELKEREIFIQNPGRGRSTSYRLPYKNEKPFSTNNQNWIFTPNKYRLSSYDR